MPTRTRSVWRRDSHPTASGKPGAVQPVTSFDRWWRQFGLDHGLWDANAPPEDHAELWLDIEEALDDAEPQPAASRRAWFAAHALPARRLCEAERAALWGLLR